MLTDANGIQLRLAAAGANAHDIRLLEQTVSDARGAIATRREFSEGKHRVVKSYESNSVRTLLETVDSYIANTKSRGDEYN